MWRLITERIASKQELDTHWSLPDMMRANAVIDYTKDAKELNSGNS